MIKQILAGLAAVATVALIQGLFYTYRFFHEKKRDELRRRLQSTEITEAAARLNLLRRGQLARSAWLSSILRGLPSAAKIEAILQQAQAPITVAQLGTYSLILALLLGLVGAVLAGASLAVFGVLVGLLSPLGVILVRRTQRSRKLSEQLPDALDMMARSLRAGHALPATFRLVSTEMPEPVNLEFGQAYEEMNLGSSFERAVLQMTARSPKNGDLKIFAVSVLIQKETGGNLVEIIEKIATTIRSRYQFFGKLRALTAEGRLSGLVLAALPFVTVLLVTFANPSYLRPLVTTSMGKWFLAYAVTCWLLGILWLRNMAKVRF